MPAVWIGSYLDGRRRIRHPEHGRVYKRLSPEPWLVERLDAEFGIRAATRMLRSLGGGYHATQQGGNSAGVIALGLARVSPHLHFDSALTAFSPEAKLQMWYQDSPADCYSLRIDDVKPLTAAVQVSHRHVQVEGAALLREVDLHSSLLVPLLDIEGLRVSDECPADLLLPPPEAASDQDSDEFEACLDCISHCSFR